MNSDSIKFFSLLFKNFESGYMKAVLLKKYWLDRICWKFQKQVAKSIREKHFKLWGRRYADAHYENRQDFIYGLGAYD